MVNTDFNKPFPCGCCGVIYPQIHKHTHHKTPKALGGKDTIDNLIDLCPGCHDALHNVAYKLMTRTHGQAKVIESLSMIYKVNVQAKQTCLDLAVQVRNAMIAQKDRGGHEPNELVNVATTIRRQHKTLIEARAKELKLSQEAYVRGCVLADLARRFPTAQINLGEESVVIKQLKKRKSF